MPEGDTIYRSAQQLKPLLCAASVVEANDNGRHQHVDSSTLVEATFEYIEAKGKHLLMHLEDGRVLHSHMGMTGSWRIEMPGKPAHRSPSRPALSIRVLGSNGDTWTINCFAPKTLELLSATQFRRHPILNRLGPDLMRNGFDRDVVVARFRLHNSAPIGEAVMNQTIVCGIGNVYKSEVLFLAKTNPFLPVADLSNVAICRIIELAQTLLHKNIAGYPRRTRMSFDGQRLWAYRRRGEPCFSCGTRIEMRRQGDLGRSTYWCPTCQSA